MIRSKVFEMVNSTIPCELKRREAEIQRLNCRDEYEANFRVSSMRSFNKLRKLEKICQDSYYYIDNISFYAPTCNILSYWEVAKKRPIGYYQVVLDNCFCYSDSKQSLYHTTTEELLQDLNYYKELLKESNVESVINMHYDMLLWELESCPNTFSRLRIGLPESGVL